MAGFALALAALATRTHKQTLWIAPIRPILNRALWPRARSVRAFHRRPELRMLRRPAMRCCRDERGDSSVADRSRLVGGGIPTRYAAHLDRDTAGWRISRARRWRPSGCCCVQKASNATSVARTRWQIAPSLSVPDESAGSGPHTAFIALFTRNRRGRGPATGPLIWDHHEQPLALSVGWKCGGYDRRIAEKRRTGMSGLRYRQPPVKRALRSPDVKCGGGVGLCSRHAARGSVRRYPRASRSRKPIDEAEDMAPARSDRRMVRPLYATR